MPQGFSRSTHKPTCPEYRQQPNAENGGFVQDSAFSCNCQSSVQPGDDMEELRCTNCNRVLGFWERHSDVPFNGAPWCETCKRGLRTLPAVGRKRIDDMPKPITFGADKEEKGCKVTPQDLGHIQPLHDRVLVRRDPPEAQTQGGIVIPSVGRTEALRGLVLGFWERHSDVPFNGAPWCETCKRGLRTLPAVGRKRIDDMPKPITFGADKEEKGCKVTPQDLGHIQPLHDRVLVRRDPPEAQTQGGIVIPSVGRTEALRGLVLGFWERHSDVPFNGAPWCETCKRGLRTLPAVGRKRIDDMPKPITFGADKEEKGCKVTPQDLGHIQPLHDRVLVRRDPPEAQTQGGIVIPSVGRTEALRGLVLAVGPGKKDEQGVFHETQVKPGDRVVISGSVNVPYGDLVKDGDLVMMSEADILGIIGL